MSGREKRGQETKGTVGIKVEDACGPATTIPVPLAEGDWRKKNIVKTIGTKPKSLSPYY